MSIKDILITDRAAALPGDYAKQHKSDLRARGRVRKRTGEMNRTEEAFSKHLEAEQFNGRVAWFGFECVKVRLADNTYYTPDFAVMYSTGDVWLIDTKGTSKADGKYIPFIEQHTKIKIKVAAEQFPFTFAIAYRLPKSAGGEWQIEEV